MKPERKVVMVERVYWTCANPDHKHATEAGAEGCLRRHPQPPSRSTNRWTGERMSELRALRESGKTFREVGDAFNIGPAQARWIYGCCVRRDAWAAEDERRRAEAAPMLAKLDAAGGTIYEKGGVFYTKTEFLATHG